MKRVYIGNRVAVLLEDEDKAKIEAVKGKGTPLNAELRDLLLLVITILTEDGGK